MNSNKHIVEETVRHVGYLPELYEDARSEKYKIRKHSLTFKDLASYIWDRRTATLQMFHFIYIFSTNISTEYFKHAAHCPLFSSKYRLFHNGKFLVSVLFKFYIQCVLKFKCKTPVPKG